MMAARFLLLTLAAANALAPSFKVQVLTCTGCAQQGFDALATFERLAADVGVEVEDVLIDGEAAPSARVLIDGEAALFGADAMTDDERRRKTFDGLTSEADAERVMSAVTKLRERLAIVSAVEADGSMPAPPRPASSASFYGEDELADLLAMHETLRSDPDAALDDAASSSPFDLHSLVQSMIEEDET